MKNRFKTLVVIGLALLGAACKEEYTPKPKGYYRIDLPTPSYTAFNEPGYPYSFEASRYCTVRPDSTRLTEPFWLDISYPGMDATVQITYKPLDNSFRKLVELSEDARRLTAKHQVKASGIEELAFTCGTGDRAFVFQLTGEVPSQFQFYTTDSTNHFFRGALYFNTATRNDSLAPVIKYISEDMVHLLNTLKWKNSTRKKA